MKRFITLALALCMVFGAALNASAAEIKASGNMWVGYDYLNVDNEGKTTDFKQRFRTQIDIVASEALSGTVFFEINNTWGQTNATNTGNGSGGALGADGVNIQTRRAYLDFLIPSTPVKVRAGIQGVALPGAVSGNVVLNDDLGAIVASASYSNVDFTAFYGRPYDAKDNGYDDSESSVDVYGLIAALNFDTITVTPYFVAANVGEDVNLPATLVADKGLTGDTQWYGVALEATPIENLVLSFDGVFGKASDDDGGFLVAGKAAYTTQYCVPAFMAWYGSGNDDDNEGRMPILDNGGDFVATTLVGEGAVGPMSDSVLGDARGKWGVALEASEITFIDKVSHVARIAYVRGTNDDDAAGLDIENWSDDDSAVEIDFTTTYNMYDNLDLVADLAFAATDFDNDNANENVDHVFKAAILAVYSF
ncbi:outer membrane homotrimeric porin [Halodesulfovibrio aestuarii]|uniref:Porin domain-containing protein n=1 Tax=Halodesulfovibrio aestuarii TaxID=126333 RepID=A0A8G2C876_9BACT|nr:outer membrane homotrimeric porin [Halodesulfovibrio aestuarii]SHI77375.1 hypothetical protein SAMN05660830_00940 [Halodesulfovibrio aestuarii]